MRQAGRALPEYHKVREGVPMLTACATPELIVEITMQPVRRYGVDAAIFFSDIVVPLKAIGIDLDIKPGVGPVVADPIRDAKGLGALRPSSPATSPTSPRPSRRSPPSSAPPRSSDSPARPSPSAPTSSRAAPPRTTTAPRP
ncbi:hypothetical protein GCM10020001_016030 [Nonomuraea salmonea]